MSSVEKTTTTVTTTTPAPAPALETEQLLALPAVWNVVKILITLIPGEVNLPLLLQIVAEVEIAGGGSFDAVFTAIIAQADKVFPDPIFRGVALVILNALHKVAAAHPSEKA